MRFILGFFLLVAVVISSALILLYVYKDEVKAAILKQLNSHLKAEVLVEPKNIDLTILGTFPDCSLQFKDVLMLEALKQKKRDTLLFANQLNLSFNVKDLWNKKYEIEKIKVTNAVIKLRVLKNGKVNYIFWEDDNTTQKNDSAHFNLKLIKFDHTRFSYEDLKSNFYAIADIRELAFTGDFRQSAYELTTRGDLLLNSIQYDGKTRLKGKDLNIDLALNVNGDHYQITKANVHLNSLMLELTGDFLFKESLSDLHLKYNAPDLEISSLISLLPESHKKKINDYESDGNLYTTGNIVYNNKNSYEIKSDFGIKNSTITYLPTSSKATNVTLEGHLQYSNSQSRLEINNVYLQLQNDEIKGSCTITNFSDPSLSLKADADLQLENIQNFFPIDTLTLLKGNLKLSTTVEGLLSDLKNQTFSDKVTLELSAKISGLQAQFKHDKNLNTVENCILEARNREVEVRDLKLNRGSSDLLLNGRIPGIFNYITDKKSPLNISGTLKSDHINMDDFLSESSGKSEAAETTLIPVNILLKLDAEIQKFTFGKFEASAITGNLDVRNQKAVFSDVKLKAMSGEAEIDVYVDNSNKRLDLAIQSTIQRLDIKQLFYQMNNFGQTTLEDKNINGMGTATLDFSGSWSNDLVVDNNSILANCNLLIERGQLTDFKPLMSLARFVDVEDLKRINFSSLQSNIQIRNKIITIPKTAIKNSALNIDFWGTHTFDNQIDYHIQLLLSELLMKKRKKKDSEFGPIANDPENKRSAFIRMTGPVDNPQIKFDKQGMKEKVRNDIKQEKETVKQVLKEEFGLFKKDSVRGREKAPQPQFKIEEEKPAPKKQLELKKKKEDEDDF